MAEDKVMKYVEGQLAKDPAVSNQTLYAGAKKLDRGVGKLSIRQFHAKYPLQVKRRKNRRRKRVGTATRRKTGGGGRSGVKVDAQTQRVRKILIDFARELSGAESQVETIEVLAKLDRYAADILKATRS